MKRPQKRYLNEPYNGKLSAIGCDQIHIAAYKAGQNSLVFLYSSDLA